jgi:hypothetical protein
MIHSLKMLNAALGVGLCYLPLELGLGIHKVHRVTILLTWYLPDDELLI